MKQAIFFAVLITVSQQNFARSISPDNNRTFFYRDSTSAKIPPMSEMLSEIIKVTGLQESFELKEADVMNIEASLSHKKRYILYNPSFIDQINKITRDKWAAMTLIAHEMGHHLNGHTIRKTGSKPELELEADEFAGFVMHQLGATLEQAQEVMFYISRTEASATHPDRNSRLLAIQKGWNKAAESAVAAVHQ